MLNDRDALAGIRCFDAPVYDLARQFRAADRVVVAAPFWDLTFPAACGRILSTSPPMA